MKAPRPLPLPDLDNAEWWAGLRRHELLVQQCQRCQALVFPPQPACPHCRSLDRGWTKTGGKGRIYSWIVVNRAFHPYFAEKVPFPVVLVEMEEGFRVVCSIDCPLDQLREGLPVEVGFEDVDENVSLLRFRRRAPSWK